MVRFVLGRDGNRDVAKVESTIAVSAVVARQDIGQQHDGRTRRAGLAGAVASPMAARVTP